MDKNTQNKQFLQFKKVKYAFFLKIRENQKTFSFCILKYCFQKENIDREQEIIRQYYYIYQNQQFQKQHLNIKDIKQNTQEIEQILENQIKNNQLECIKLEQEAQKNIKYAIQITKCKQNLKENFPEDAKNQLQNIQNLPLDIYFDIIESDYIYKKNYNPILFDESKRKFGVNSIDLLLYINKLNNEAQFFTFSSMYLQNKITKVIQCILYLISFYIQRHINILKVNFRIIILIIQSNQILMLLLLKQVFFFVIFFVIYFSLLGNIIIKNHYCQFNNSNKFIYILGSLDKTKLTATEINQEEINKIILNEEKDSIYGNVKKLNQYIQLYLKFIYQIFINSEDLNDLLQQCLDLKSNMQESDKKTPLVKERDYKYHKMNFRNIIAQFGAFFFQKECEKDQKNNFKKGEKEIDYLDKYVVFVPYLNIENIQIFIDIFSNLGLQIKNMNILAILRYFHHNKYK
ncbi:hypothetical protein IMG5_155340 [Ichthyophthirius multifiliis]|uniref:Transmembrane protein n=1 Tax=Ichthyophthirius multifiliis TaxID=5932 RepID=G0QZA0_ICHMU|nr:hypothetical protein IMG5_155340 [Ichthyophthirius multifiliis]EGR29457.1 hypothetical protein IMG5_155340 [Ichthyophthirius multifiliis]|eukprot:XP_004030693.1 hypothetical protein IMG5_155340 [Ichthyophthirius multifiliis]